MIINRRKKNYVLYDDINNAELIDDINNDDLINDIVNDDLINVVDINNDDINENEFKDELIEEDKDELIEEDKDETSLFFRISMSIIIGLNIFIVFLIISFFFNKPLLIAAIITSGLTMILIFVYQTLRKEKNLFIASLLNMTPLYPTGFLYTTEQALPGFNVKQLSFFLLHVFLSFTIVLSPIITFISGWLGYYPVKKGKELKLF